MRSVKIWLIPTQKQACFFCGEDHILYVKYRFGVKNLDAEGVRGIVGQYFLFCWGNRRVSSLCYFKDAERGETRVTVNPYTREHYTSSHPTSTMTDRRLASRTPYSPMLCWIENINLYSLHFVFVKSI